MDCIECCCLRLPFWKLSCTTTWREWCTGHNTSPSGQPAGKQRGLPPIFLRPWFGRGGDAGNSIKTTSEITCRYSCLPELLLACFALQYPRRHGHSKVPGQQLCLLEQPLGSRSRADPHDPDWSAVDQKHVPVSTVGMNIVNMGCRDDFLAWV
jgi:hypothetical protein